MKKINSTNIKKDTELVATIKVCILVFAFACTQASIAGEVFTIWLKSNIGLNAEQIGQLFAMKAMFAIFYKPVFGYLLDKFQLKKTFIIIIPIAGVFIGPFFQYVYAPLIMNPSTFYLGGILGGLYFGFIIIAGGAAIMNYSDRYIRAHGGTVGKVTAFFAGGIGFMGFLSTVLYNINPAYNFDLSSVCCLIVLIMIISFKTKVFHHIDTKILPKEKMKITDILILLKNIDFFVLISFVIFCTAIQWVSNAQLGNYTTTFWDTKTEAVQIIGYFSIPFAIISFIALMFSSKVIKTIGVNKGILVVHSMAITFFIIIGVAGFTHSRIIYICARFIGETSNALFYVTILTYISVKFDQRINGITFLVGFHFLNNLTMLLTGSELGKIFDHSGFAQGYIDLAVISSLGLLLTLTLIKVSTMHKQVRHV